MVKLTKGALLLLFTLALTLELSAQGQQRYFVYLQSDHAQPFYVRYDGKVLSSSDKGYLILSKIPAGTITFRLGFAKSDVPEQQYHLKLSGPNDYGYMVKPDAANGGYTLYNLQSFAMVKADQPKEQVVVVDTLAPVVPIVAAVAVDTPVAVAQQPAPVMDSAIAPPVAVDSAAVMMASVKKDLDSTFANKPDVVVARTPRRPAAPVAVVAPPVVKQPNKFSQALDKVLGDDRVEDTTVAEPIVSIDSAVVMEDSASMAPVVPEGKKGRKKHKDRDRDPLTVEEQQILSDVMANEKKAGEADSVSQVVPAPVDSAAVVAAPVPVPEKRVKRSKRAKSDAPDFIEFQDSSVTRQPVVEDSVTEAPAPVKKKKRSRVSDAIDSSASPVLTDSVGYAVADLSIDHPKKKRAKKAEVDSVAAAEDGKPAVKMINSDCAKVFDEDDFRKFLRKFVAAKDDDGMIDVFRKQTKGYCLETAQIKSLTQLLGTDDARYRLLDYAYPKVYDTERFPALENLLTDDYYKGRFKAMLHK